MHGKKIPRNIAAKSYELINQRAREQEPLHLQSADVVDDIHLRRVAKTPGRHPERPW